MLAVIVKDVRLLFVRPLEVYLFTLHVLTVSVKQNQQVIPGDSWARRDGKL